MFLISCDGALPSFTFFFPGGVYYATIGSWLMPRFQRVHSLRSSYARVLLKSIKSATMVDALCLHLTDAFSRSLHAAWWHRFIMQHVSETGRRWSLVLLVPDSLK
ncbi:hypothetical protein BDV33DRAFT_67754 [Aspergillus novoparasiticus]|uniref:Uncharacterized protein n=1 Tax=Aspergillus novoparasiticus TaxID=986946 RepID=A0A5N6EYE6_9EURO|nr:hypothetical protein BDV33DRAFT_67754 [Aspergillus novoparasiticus]